MKSSHIRSKLISAAILLLCAAFALPACGKKDKKTEALSFENLEQAVQSASETNQESSAPAGEGAADNTSAQTEQQPENSASNAPAIEPPPPVIHADGTIDGGGDVQLDINLPAQTEAQGNPAVSPSVSTGSNIAGNYAASAATLAETEDMGQDYLDSIVFLGDSTTYGMRYYEMLSGGKNTTQVWTPANGTLTLSYQSVATIVYPETNTEIPIRDAVELKKPAYMVITLGVNGISFMDGEYFKSEYTDLVRGIQARSPDTKIILQSIFPVAASYEYMSSINNDKIAAANQWVIEIAEQTGCRYLATSSALIGSDGFLPESYQNGDGLHLDTDGFNIVVNYIRTHGYK
ncbi:MAG: SGNH/GDSL hydrolase family protein [Oscillospiraceae bacterium]|nr:SGNH/GDSL hydrolase family protein [Oscillospiraceae bacterium]